jgi:putative transposase
MPWLETAPMEQRERFIRDEQLALYTMTELCERYGISRKTGYKWLGRFDEGGRQALADRSRAPHQCLHRISEETAQLICDARRQHPTWRPDKLLDWLEPRHPDSCLACRQHRWRSVGSHRSGDKTPPPPRVYASGRRAGHDHAAE